MPRITFLNGIGNGFANAENVLNGTTVASLFNSKFPGQNPADFTIQVNDSPADGADLIREGDSVTMFRRVPVAAPEAAEETVSFVVKDETVSPARVIAVANVPVSTTLDEALKRVTTAHVGRQVVVSGEVVDVSLELADFDGDLVSGVSIRAVAAQQNIRVLLVSNDGAGFGDRINVPSGQTVGGLLSVRGLSVEGKRVRVNGADELDRQRVLRDGDTVSLVPLKVEGGAGEVRVLLVMNDDSGFGDWIYVNQNTTVSALFYQKVPSGRPENYKIRVNSRVVEINHVLQNGDRVAFVPAKVDGGLSR